MRCPACEGALTSKPSTDAAGGRRARCKACRKTYRLKSTPSVIGETLSYTAGARVFEAEEREAERIYRLHSQADDEYGLWGRIVRDPYHPYRVDDL